METQTESSHIRVLAQGRAEGHGARKLPFLLLPRLPMEVFDPQRHGRYSGLAARSGGSLPFRNAQNAGKDARVVGVIKDTGPLPLFYAAKAAREVALIPREEDCHALWDKYGMMSHIQEHSRKVADLAVAIARFGKEQGADVCPESVLAAGLLHDLGKTYSILHGGDHAQLGAAWIMRETRNALVAQAVLYHVHWWWEDILEECVYNDELFNIFVLIYADKRVMHDTYVKIDDRYTDLQKRYGKTEQARIRIEASRVQGKTIEAVLSRRLGVQLNEYIADSRRLVKRA